MDALRNTYITEIVARITSLNRYHVIYPVYCRSDALPNRVCTYLVCTFKDGTWSI